MPADAAFDTRAEFRRFVDAGADERLADAIVDHSRETLRGLATKEDLRTLETALETKIDTSFNALNTKIDMSVAGLDARMDASIAGLDARIDMSFNALNTKIDMSVAGLDARMGASIAEIRTGDIPELKADIAELRVGLRWLAGIGAGIVAILVGAFGFFFSMLVGMTADIAALQTTLATQGADLAAQGNDIAAIKDALAALAAR